MPQQGDSMSASQLKNVGYKIKKLGEEVRKNLGCGFTEAIYQNALAIEFRNNKIEYLKEVNIEIFYKGESLGADRPDFIVTKAGALNKPFIIETKVSDKISDDHRTQLQSYCTSLPFNNNPVLKDIAGGMLLTFPKCEIDSCATMKIFVVDAQFNVLVDEQKEEEKRKALEKEIQKKQEKEEKERTKKKSAKKS